MTKEKINFRQARDFTETFNVSIKFLRQNFKMFFKCLILIAGPFVLMSAIAGAFYQSHAISMMSLAKLGSNVNAFSRIIDQFGWTYAIFIIATIVASLMMVNTVFSFMIIYNEKGPEEITMNEVSTKVIKNIGNVLSIFLSFTFTTILILVVIVGIIIGISSGVPALGILLVFLLVIGLMIVLPPIMWLLSAMYLVKMNEGISVSESFTKTKDALRGNFWWTWVIFVGAGIAVMIANFAFALPQAAYQMVLMFTRLKGSTDEVSVSFLIVATVCTFCTTTLYSVMHVISGFHYFSLAEKNDGKGLLERIDEIGTTPTNNVEQHF